MVIGMAQGVIQTFRLRRCAKREVTKSPPRCAMLSARRRKSTSQSMVRATTNGSLESMRLAVSISSSMVWLIVARRSASLELLRKRGRVTWRIAAQLQTVTHIVSLPGLSRQQASVWHEAMCIFVQLFETFPNWVGIHLWRILQAARCGILCTDVHIWFSLDSYLRRSI